MKKSYLRGRPRIKVYQYNRKGEYIQSWDAIADVRQKYYDEKYEGKFPIFPNNLDYHVLPDDTMLLKERLGRKAITHLFNRLENPLIFKGSQIKPVEVLNMDGDVVATFINPKALKVFTGLTDSMIWCYLNKNEKKNLPHNKLRINLRYQDVGEGKL